MASVFGYEVEAVYLGFTFLTLFVTVLFALSNVISSRQYRLLREQFEALKRELAGDVAASRSIAEEAVETTRQAKLSGGAARAPEALEKKLVELEGKQKLLGELVGGLRNSPASVDVNLRKKISFVKKLGREAGLHAKAVKELAREVNSLKREFRKHEVTPLHEGGDAGVHEEVERAFDELVSVESKVNKLAKRLAQAQKKAAKAKKLAETEPKKRVSKKVFRKTVGAIRKKIEKTTGRKKKREEKEDNMPPEQDSQQAPAQAAIQSRAPDEVNAEKKLFE